MSKRPVNAGDYVLVQLEVTHRLNDGYLIVMGPSLSPITVHEDDVQTIAAVRSRHAKARPSRLVAVA